MTPYSIVIQHAICAISILANYVVYVGVWWAIPSYDSALGGPLNCLLGKSSRDSASQHLSTENETPRLSGTRIETFRKILLEKFGPCLVWMVFSVQCCCSIFLYVRRRQHSAESVTLADQRIFELALGGVLVAILIIGSQVLAVGWFAPRVVRFRTYLDHWLGFLGSRGETLVHENCEKWWEISVALKDFIISFIIMLIMGKFRLAPTVKTWWANKDLSDGRVEGIFIIVAMFSSGMVSGVHTGQLMVFDCLFIYLLGFPVICLFILWAVYFFPMLLLLGFAAAPTVAIREYIRLYTQLSTFQAWPQDVACPMLWKDPLADWVWWLA
jgi:hypothetical protein